MTKTTLWGLVVMGDSSQTLTNRAMNLLTMYHKNYTLGLMVTVDNSQTLTRHAINLRTLYDKNYALGVGGYE